MALPSPYLAPAFPRRGVTVLELLIVLTLMGVASALVAPVFARRAPAPGSVEAPIVAAARHAAIRRAEPLRLRMSANGAWSIVAQRDGAVVDSGHVLDALPTTDLLLDALGGCVPSPQVRGRAFDPMTCSLADEVARP